MPKHIIQTADGVKHVFEAPEGTTPEQVMAFAAQTLGQQQAQPPGALQSFAEGAGQGLTLNTSDELEGAARAAYAKATGTEPGPNPNIETDDQDRSFNALFSRFSGEARKRQAAEAAAHPWAYGTGEIAGGVGGALATGGGGIGIRGAEGIGSRVLGGAVEGGTYGGLYGAGGGEPGQRTGGAVQGTVGGAALGGILPPAIDVGSALLGPMARGIRAMSEPKQVSNEKLAEALGRDFGASGAAGQLQTAASDLNARMAGAAASGKPLILADFMGDNGRKLMRAALNMPNDKRNAFQKFVNDRQTGTPMEDRAPGIPIKSSQSERLEADMAAGLGNPADYKASVDQIAAERAKNATQDFKAAYNQPWNVKANDRLPDLLQRPYMQRLLQKTSDKISGVTGEDPAALSPWEFLHRVRMQINKEITGLKSGRPDPVANWDASDLTTLRGQLDKAIAKNNPEFGKAINGYADESALKDAAEEGLNDALKMPYEDLAQKMRSFTNQNEADMWRMGASRALVQKFLIADKNKDLTKGALNSRDFDLRAKALYPDQQSLDAFYRNVGFERDMYGTRAAAQGNSTTASQAIEGEEAAKPARAISAIGNAMVGRFGEALLSGLSRGANKFSGMTPATANATLETMMTPVQRGGTMVIPNALRAAMTHAAQIPANRAQVSNALIGGGVPLVGRQTMGPDSEFDPYRR